MGAKSNRLESIDELKVSYNSITPPGSVQSHVGSKTMALLGEHSKKLTLANPSIAIFVVFLHEVVQHLVFEHLAPLPHEILQKLHHLFSLQSSIPISIVLAEHLFHQLYMLLGRHGSSVG